MPEESLNPVQRPRRLRLSPLLRGSLAGVRLQRRDIIMPVFVCEGAGVRREVGSMPGVYQMSVDVAADWLEQRAKEGFAAYLVFGVIDKCEERCARVARAGSGECGLPAAAGNEGPENRDGGDHRSLFL